MKDLFEIRPEYVGTQLELENGVFIDCDSDDIYNYYAIAPYLFKVKRDPALPPINE